MRYVVAMTEQRLGALRREVEHYRRLKRLNTDAAFDASLRALIAELEEQIADLERQGVESATR
jgi:hypothetical protein